MTRWRSPAVNYSLRYLEAPKMLILQETMCLRSNVCMQFLLRNCVACFSTAEIAAIRFSNEIGDWLYTVSHKNTREKNCVRLFRFFTHCVVKNCSKRVSAVFKLFFTKANLPKTFNSKPSFTDNEVRIDPTQTM